MSNLHQQSCEACRADAPKVNQARQAELMTQLDGWEIVDKKAVLQLSKTYDFPDFVKAIHFANKVAELAEKYS